MLNLGLFYDESKLKSSLSMAVIRMQLHVNKKNAIINGLKKEVAKLLENDAIEKARIKAESIIREDFNIEAYNLLEMYCDLGVQRIKYITSCKEVPVDLKQAISSLVWSADRIDIDELVEVKKQFSKKFGSTFMKLVECNPNDAMVSDRVMHKLSVVPPDFQLVTKYLCNIAREYNIDIVETKLGLPETGPIPTPSGFSIPMAPGSNIADAYIEEIASSNEHSKAPISSASRSDTSILKRNNCDKTNDNTITVTAFPVTNAVVEGIFQYPVVPRSDDHSSPKYTEEKMITAHVIPAPVISSAPVIHTETAESSHIKLYKVENDTSLFNSIKLEENSASTGATNTLGNENNDLLELERRLAELSKPSSTDNLNQKEYSL